MKKIVVIGGGTGNFVILNGLKQYSVELTAIASMTDDGGGAGILRDELGVLPPGDVRQCLVALSNSSRLMRSLMNYRFENGGLEGHSLGNLLLSALEKITGSFEKAVEEVGKILYIKGKVIPLTTHQVRLKMVLKNQVLLEGEKEIYLSKEIDQGYEKIYLDPFPSVNPHVIDAILNADLLIIGPGGLYTSLIPNLLIQGMSEAICKSPAKKVLVINLMNRKGQTTGFKTSHYLKELTRYLHQDLFDVILFNNQKPSAELIEIYAQEGELVENDLKDPRLMSVGLLGKITMKSKRDVAQRSLIRHDSKKLAQALMHILYENDSQATLCEMV